jgi:hypothetical protein
MQPFPSSLVVRYAPQDGCFYSSLASFRYGQMHHWPNIGQFVGTAISPGSTTSRQKHVGWNNARPWRTPPKCGSTTHFAVVVVSSRLASVLWARSTLDAIAAAASSSPRFRSVVNCWARLTTFRSVPMISRRIGCCQSSTLTGSFPDHYGFGAVARHGFVFEKESERWVSSQVYAIDRRMRLMMATRSAT